MDPLNVPYFHFRWVLKLLTSHKCRYSHPVQIHDSNHTCFLISFSRYSSWPMVTPTERENRFLARNGGPTWPEDLFLSQFVQRRSKMAHPGQLHLSESDMCQTVWHTYGLYLWPWVGPMYVTILTFHVTFPPRMYICAYVLRENRSLIQSLALMRSAITQLLWRCGLFCVIQPHYTCHGLYHLRRKSAHKIHMYYASHHVRMCGLSACLQV